MANKDETITRKYHCPWCGNRFERTFRVNQKTLAIIGQVRCQMCGNFLKTLQ